MVVKKKKAKVNMDGVAGGMAAPPSHFKEDDVSNYWLDFVRKVLLSKHPVYVSSAGRRYVSNTGFSVPGPAWEKGFPLQMNNLGYRGEGSKIGQLKRVYFNEEGAAAAKEKLTERMAKKKDFTSVMVPTQSGQKRKASQGHCMAAVVVTYINNRGEQSLNINILYRATEVIQKFAADLIFLHDVVIPAILPDELPCPITSVNFQFVNAFFSPLFMPVLYPFIDPIEFLEILEKNMDMDNPRDKSTVISCYRAMVLPLVQKDPEHYNYRTRRVMHTLALDAVKAGHIDEEKLREYFKKNGMLDKYMSGEEEEEDEE